MLVGEQHEPRRERLGASRSGRETRRRRFRLLARDVGREPRHDTQGAAAVAAVGYRADADRPQDLGGSPSKRKPGSSTPTTVTLR